MTERPGVHGWGTVPDGPELAQRRFRLVLRVWWVSIQCVHCRWSSTWTTSPNHWSRMCNHARAHACPGVETHDEWAERMDAEGRAARRGVQLAELLDGVYTCARVWDAWEVGTMTDADFSPASEDDVLLAGLQSWRDSAVSDELMRQANNLLVGSFGSLSVHLAASLRERAALLRAEVAR